MSKSKMPLMYRQPLPRELAERMKEWRRGWISLPKEFIEFHRDQALLAIAFWNNDRYEVKGVWMDDDGWLDGMRFVHIAVEDRKTRRLEKMKWADNQRWYIQQSFGGWALV